MNYLLNLLSGRIIFILFLFSFFCNAQDIQVEVLGGSTVPDGSVVAISAGNTISFRITNIRTDCEKVKIESISLTNTTDFIISTDKVPKHVDSPDCKGKNNNIDFTITNISGNCGASTDIIIEVKKDPDFFFTFSINGNPEINLLGGSPSANILNGSTTTAPANGTYFGVVDEGNAETRYYIIANTGSCPLSITSITSSSTDFVVPTSPAPYVLLPNNSPSFLTVNVAAGSYVILPVTFIAPAAGSGTLTSTISISNTANTVFTFNVSAEMFNYNIPGPGGITADFRLWLKSTRGVIKSSSKVSQWSDIGTNGKHAIQPISGAQPTYLDDQASNINFNPVIKFENDGSTISQYLYNLDNGFYNQDIFIVMKPDEDVTSSAGMTIFSGSISDILPSGPYVDDADDVTGIGLGNYTTNLTGERLWYNQGSSATSPYYALPAASSRTYNTPGIINAGNKTTTVSDGMRIIFNSVDDALSSTQTITSFQNVGYIDTSPDPDIIYGTPYFIGKNTNATLGNLNGRVAEIFTFAERVSDADRHKIESYLAIKYGITLGGSNTAQKDYINSFGTKVWDISSNSGYNYHVAGIGRDSISDLNQKQSKTLNIANEVTIGLKGVFTTNNLNINEFDKDGDFLVWGSNNDAYSASGTNTVTIASGITTSVTRILRQWKIVESTEDINSDVENIEISIPIDAFSGFALSANEEYVLIVADDDAFANGDIIDVIPLKLDGVGNLKTWYDFDGIKYFTFGKASKLSENHSINIDSGDYLVGEYDLNLNANDFTISAWVKANTSQTSTRTIMAKGSKLQLRLNSSHQIEVMLDDDSTPRFISSMALNDNKWHQISFVYISGTIYLYVDGVLDKSEQNVVAPTPNFNRFSIGAVYIDKNNIINPFLGKIDEVYIWDQGLTEDQVQFLMNQEVEKGTGNFVTGKLIPQSSSSNEVAMIPWSKLKAYYDFNSFYGTTVEGLVDNRHFLRINYLAKNKDVVDNQTTPLPYISANDGAWDSATTWSNSMDQVIPNSLGLDGVTMIDWNIVQIGHDVTSGDRDIYLLGLIQTAGTLTIADPNDAQDETNSGQALVIINYLELDGVIDLVGESQLVQTEGSIIDADSGGYIERDQQGTANSFNYNYWSSSVGPIGGNTSSRGTGISSTNSNYAITGVLNDGTSSSSYQGLTYSASAFAADSSTPTTPKTTSTHWLYKFYGPSDSYNSWIKINQLSSLLAGEGFTMKGTSGTAALSDYQNYVFKGLPNNGDISLPLNKISGANVDRLIGNPYPSAIDAIEFILDNLSVADGGNNTNGTIFNGALYFWDHFGEQNSHILKDYVGGYATYSLIGGAVAISNDTRIDANLSTGSKIPGQYIPVNQGFFVSTTVDGFENDNEVPIATVDGGDIVFKNSQRVFATEDGSTSLFLKPSIRRKVTTRETNSKTSKQIIANNPVIRLMYDSPMGYHRQLVLGKNNKASNKFDIGYDAFIADINQEDMYWIIDGSKCVIQGVGDFDASQELPLGLVVKKAGLARIKVDTLENIDPKLNLYIKDEVTKEVFEINNKPFEIYLESGSYNDRFKLVFQPSETSAKFKTSSEVDINNTISVFYNTEISELKIINKHNINISEVRLYNMLGQNKKTIKLNSSKDVSIPITPDSGIHIIKVNTNNGVVNKKINVE